jgi:hypothetical protein
MNSDTQELDYIITRSHVFEAAIGKAIYIPIPKGYNLILVSTSTRKIYILIYMYHVQYLQIEVPSLSTWRTKALA